MIDRKSILTHIRHTLLAASIITAAMAFSTQAHAQMTPQAYCANISGCELLGVKPTYNIDNNSGTLVQTVCGSGAVAGDSQMLVEYCRGNVYKIGVACLVFGSIARWRTPVANADINGVNTTALTNTNVCADTVSFP